MSGARRRRRKHHLAIADIIAATLAAKGLVNDVAPFILARAIVARMAGHREPVEQAFQPLDPLVEIRPENPSQRSVAQFACPDGALHDERQGEGTGNAMRHAVMKREMI